jgi:hypothetical protein
LPPDELDESELFESELFESELFDSVPLVSEVFGLDSAPSDSAFLSVPFDEALALARLSVR